MSRIPLLAVVIGASFVSSVLLQAHAAPAADLPVPVNISCQSLRRDGLVMSWKDDASDETGWKVERSIGGATWTEVATLPANAYLWNEDSPVDPAVINRRYRVRSYRNEPAAPGGVVYSPYSEACSNRRVLEVMDNGKFRIFYGLRGTDACPSLATGEHMCTSDISFVQRQMQSLVGSRAAFMRAGFTQDVGIPPHGNDAIPLNIAWCDGGGCADLNGMGMSPMLIERSFDHVARTGDPSAYVVTEHEMFHFQQFKYPGIREPASGWVMEAQARMSQDRFCLGADRATALCFDDIDTGYAGYVADVNNYLANAHQSLRLSNYTGALYWTYMLEKFGRNFQSDPVEHGNDFLVKFWEATISAPLSSGPQMIDAALSANGYTHTFRTSFQDFIIANYAKNLTRTVDSKYQYEDMKQRGGTYSQVMLSVNIPITPTSSFLNIGESVDPWGARYYEFRPTANVTALPITVTQDTAGTAFYVVLGIRDRSIVREIRRESRNLELTLMNEGFDRVVVIVAGLENAMNYRISVNGARPSLTILQPLQNNAAFVNDPADPDKFLVTVDLLDAAGLPLPGIRLDQFSFRIGSRDVPRENIVGAAIVQGQAWFVIRAVTQTMPIRYHLTVDYQNVLSATELFVVDYYPSKGVDNVLVIDRSGSMAYADKMTATQQAAKLYIDSWMERDRIAVESFNGLVEMPLPMTAWSTNPTVPPNGSREDAHAAIDSLTAFGSTAIGDAIMRGWDELKARGSADADWAIILLSDGMQTSGVKEFPDAITAIQASSDKTPSIHTVAVGPDADRVMMQQAARGTLGAYHFVSAPADGTAARGAVDASASLTDALLLPLRLDEKYRFIATQVADQQQFFSLNGPTHDAATEEWIEIPVDAKAREMVLSLSWLPGVAAFQLYDPLSNTVAPALQVAGRQATWRVNAPKSGVWTLYVRGVRNEQGVDSLLSSYYLQGSLRTTLALQAFVTTPADELAPGRPFHLTAFLNDSGPVGGATMTATVSRPDPDRNLVDMVMHDDGAHGDGEAGDGVYGGTFTATALSGSYQVKIAADGYSVDVGTFHREALLSVHLKSEGDDGDSDQDGMPDPWEKRHQCLKIGQSDGDGDPDKDGASSAKEYRLGTDPCDPDSDEDGEADGTDQRPLEHDENRAEPPWAVAWPGREQAWVKYVASNLARVHVYRRTSAGAAVARVQPTAYSRGEATVSDADPYVLIGTQEPATGVFLNEVDVVNDLDYCYLVVGETFDGQRTVAHDETCTTPRYDPVPPQGGLVIDDGANLSRGRTVKLKLIASDEISPHTAEDHGGAGLEPPHDAISGVTAMRIGNDPEFMGVSWEPYAAERTWVLSDTHAPSSVYVQYRDGAGNLSRVYAAAIHIGSGVMVYVPALMKP